MKHYNEVNYLQEFIKVYSWNLSWMICDFSQVTSKRDIFKPTFSALTLIIFFLFEVNFDFSMLIDLFYFTLEWIFITESGIFTQKEREREWESETILSSSFLKYFLRLPQSAMNKSTLRSISVRIYELVKTRWRHKAALKYLSRFVYN